MFVERRAALRQSVAVPVLLLDGSTAVTRNISADGLFIELPSGASLDAVMALDYPMPTAGLRFLADAHVVRTEISAGCLGVAFRLRGQRLSPLG